MTLVILFNPTQTPEGKKKKIQQTHRKQKGRQKFKNKKFTTKSTENTKETQQDQHKATLFGDHAPAQGGRK
jgi:hypothetical protein